MISSTCSVTVETGLPPLTRADFGKSLSLSQTLKVKDSQEELLGVVKGLSESGATALGMGSAALVIF